ncbi:hypothetical protein [Enterovirga aerilata]|uniref:Uncharacterized protein n=1 Tax=Enterovirga aerilata TaxID=2730920 RepID=A0A849I0B4_9HYPH|nr:hypothetical protein [Enterovirga sp. DB1703]NNM71004.1 hypothetical protein [Enterovirga sp. DB1703]
MGRCACCYRELADTAQTNAHHVVPIEQVDERVDFFKHQWLKSSDNCVVVCREPCHTEIAHHAFKTSGGYEAPPEFFPFSHGIGNSPAHRAWIRKIKEYRARLFKEKGWDADGDFSGGGAPSGGGPPEGTFVPPPALPALPNGAGGAASVGLAILAMVAVARNLATFVRNCKNAGAAAADLVGAERDIDEKRRRDPTLGCLVALTYRVEVGVGTVSFEYESVKLYYNYSEDKALATLRISPPYRLKADPFGQDAPNMGYSVEAIWIKPVKTAVFSKDISGTIASIDHAMYNPPDREQAFHILNGCRMHDILQIYVTFMKDGKHRCLWENIGSAKGINRERLSLAVAAIDYKKQGIPFAKFAQAMGTWMPASGTQEYNELAAFYGTSAPASDTGHAIVGNWGVKIGGWSGAFSFTRDGKVSWNETGGKPHPGKWWRYQGAVNWQFDDDPPGFQRTFEAVEPIGPSVSGRILPEGQGFFSMAKR